MTSDYNGGLTREQFLFYEIRTVASLLTQGLSRKEIAQEGKTFPVECQFCDAVYSFTPEDIGKLLEKI